MQIVEQFYVPLLHLSVVCICCHHMKSNYTVGEDEFCKLQQRFSANSFIFQERLASFYSSLCEILEYKYTTAMVARMVLSCRGPIANSLFNKPAVS